MAEFTIESDAGVGWRGALVLLAIGVGLGAAGMWGLLDTPGELERSRVAYDEQIRNLEAQADEFAADAEAIRGEAIFHREKAREAEARVLELAADLERPAFLDAPPVVRTIPALVLSRTPPEVVERLRYFEDVFRPQMQEYTQRLEGIVNAQAEEIRYLKLALAGAEEASEKWRLAYEAERERGDVADARVQEYEKAFFRRRGVMVGAAVALVAVLVVAQ